MKAYFLLAILLSAQPVLAQAEPAAPGAPPAQQELTEAQREFLNLPEETRQKFAGHVTRAVELFQLKRIFETLDEIAKAEAIFGKSHDLLNLKGSCYVEMRNFERALEAYKRADELSPNNPSILFNIAEVYFVTQQWQESHDRFAVLAEITPESDLAFKRLAEFKLMLSKKSLGKDEEAAVLADKYDFRDDSPYHYYAEAAKAYAADDLIKAEEWIGRANRVFQNPAILAPWQDTLVEYGYIKSFYGEGATEE